MTDEQTRDRVVALLRERTGYEVRAAGYAEAGDDDRAKEMRDRVEQVNAQLRSLGAEGAAPAKRAERRTAKKTAKKPAKRS